MRDVEQGGRSVECALKTCTGSLVNAVVHGVTGGRDPHLEAIKVANLPAITLRRADLRGKARYLCKAVGNSQLWKGDLDRNFHYCDKHFLPKNVEPKT